jgi:hypothetical protein
MSTNHDGNRASCAYIYALGTGFCQVAKKMISPLPNCWRSVFNILVKNKDANLIWQTVRDALSHHMFHREGLEVAILIKENTQL